MTIFEIIIVALSIIIPFVLIVLKAIDDERKLEEERLWIEWLESELEAKEES